MIFVNQLMSSEPFSEIRGLIFDCDGVMVDSLNANIWYYNRFKQEFGLDLMTPDEQHYCHVHNVFESLKHILPKELWERAFAFRETLDYRDVLPHLDAEPGLHEFVYWLNGAGYNMAVNTNRTDTMDLVLQKLGLCNFFNPVMTTVTVRFPKPHPEGVNHILDAWRLLPDEVAYIGDSVVDERTAHAAGVPFWAFKNTDLSADLYVSDFFTLKSAMVRARAEDARLRNRV